jgi:uncharacterized protein (DUF433 family)
MTTFHIQAESPPLREDNVGGLRIGKSRVLLEIVIRAFQDGATPETIVQQYPTIELAEVYSVIAYYLRHSAEVANYLSKREKQAEEIAHRIQTETGDLTAIRARLLAKRKT